MASTSPSSPDAKEGNFSNPLTHFPQPDIDVLADRFQGYAAYGQYIYFLTGDSYDDSGGEINLQVSNVDMNTGEVVEGPFITRADSTLTFREAKGMAIYQKADGETRLFLGFASGEPDDRRSNLFFQGFSGLS